TRRRLSRIALRRRSRKRLPEAVEHPLLALAHPLGVEAHEAALLRGVRGLLRGFEQPPAHRRGIFRRGLLGDDAVDLAELLEDLDAGVRALGRLEAPDRVLPVPGVRHDLARERADQLTTLPGLSGPHGLQSRRRLLHRL